MDRKRPPQPGDHWKGCNSARAAGTAPIYAGEPGYDESMDGDGDGIACEPHPDAGF
ncbi:excalibur calcium-binding domain-containing protein [Novosphingobium sp.]|uniref:excalibur calcium-binding domain-containing protein n=1 Tax=Novosphingobium sp. TaxID=1874826 RepID=UPI0025D431E0|nr:excalibur calcium-binding domain-containing protein [Novosphingobium sp.]